MALTFGNKIENEGATAQGRLTAAEFNTLVSAVNQNETDIGRIELHYALIDGLSIVYSNADREIYLRYTRNGTATNLATISANDFIIGGSLVSASYEDEDGEGNAGDFLKLEFSTNDTVYIDLQPIVSNAMSLINSRLTALESKHVVLTETAYENLSEVDENTFYYTYEEEEEGEGVEEEQTEGGGE